MNISFWNKFQDEDLDYLKKGVVQGTYKLLDGMKNNDDRVRDVDVTTLVDNIRTMLEGVDNFRDKYQLENFRAHCTSTSYMTHLMSTLRKNNIAAGTTRRL